MDKIVSVSSLKKVTNGIINKIDDLIDERLDGKSFKYLTLAEYEALSDAEKNDDTIAYHITDAQLSYNDLVDKPTIPENVTDLKSAKDGTSNFSIAPGKYVKMRVYVWLEGQDVDCINYASLGGGMTINVGLSKAGTDNN